MRPIIDRRETAAGRFFVAAGLAEQKDYRNTDLLPVAAKIGSEGKMLDAEPEGRIAWRDNFGGPYTVEGRRKRFSKAEPSYRFHDRDIEWRILSPAGICAVAKFVEWRASPESDISQFIEEADASSQADQEMAFAIQQSWGWPIFPFDYGTVIRFDRLVIDTAKDAQRLVWSYMGLAIRREFSDRVAIMILKAFPLEYESEVVDKQRAAFERRFAALLRLYRFRLDALPLPNRWGKKGWMWKSLRFDEEPGDYDE